MLDAVRADMRYEGVKTKCSEVKGVAKAEGSLSWTASRRLERVWGCGVMGSGKGVGGVKI